MLSVVEAPRRPFDYAQGDIAFNVPNKTKISLLYNTVAKACASMYFAEVQKCLKFVMLSVVAASL